MNKALGISDNCDVEDECDMAGSKEMDDENIEKSWSYNFDSSSDHQEYSLSFCDLKIKEKEDVTSYIERRDGAYQNMEDSSSTQPTCPFCQECFTTEGDVVQHISSLEI